MIDELKRLVWSIPPGCYGCVVFTAFVVVTTALTTLLFRALWNAIIADVFGGPELTLLQAFLAMLLINLLGSNFRR